MLGSLAPRRSPMLRRRLAIVGAVGGASLLAVMAQLVSLQILAGPEMAALSDKNRVRLRPVPAPRGILYDRNGLPLVENRPAFTLIVTPRDTEDLDAVVNRLSVLLRVPVADLRERFTRVPVDSPWPVRLSRGLTLEEVARLEEWKLELPGVSVEMEPQRSYPGARFAAHLLGYVREASESDLQAGGVNGRSRTSRLRRGDLVGQSGLERLYDDRLRGQDGAEQLEVDAHGRPMRILDREDPVPGGHVRTTIDRRVQQAAEEALGDLPGAVVVVDPRNGDVRALVSHPAFSVERFSGPMDRETWLGMVRDPSRPLLNRAIGGLYPPGSVFKLVVAAAALQAQLITPFDRLSCPTVWWFGGRGYHNWEDRDRGALTLGEALQHSCNTFFYQLGLKVGPERIAEMAGALGLGRGTDSGLLGERAGLVPDPGWKRQALRDRWHPGDTVSLAIGQGLVTVTPLEVARMIAAIANGGTLWKPRLVERVEAPDHTLRRFDPPVVQGRVEVAPVILDYLREAMVTVVEEGTGKRARVPGIAIAGKTGTAQTHEFRSDADRKRRDHDHAWFAGFAPADGRGEPEAVVVVFVEHGGLGGQVAAPIAQAVFRALFLEQVAQAS